MLDCDRSGRVPELPPAFLPVRCTGPALPRALAAARAGADAGTLLWTERAEQADGARNLHCAVVFEPDRSLAEAMGIAVVAGLAAVAALTAPAPPNRPVGLDWSGTLLLDGAVVGGLRLGWPPGAAPDAVPDWLVAGLTVRLAFAADDQAPGRDPSRTALEEEGFGPVDALALLESFARHLLHGIHRWDEDGLAPQIEEWRRLLVPRPGLHRAPELLDMSLAQALSNAAEAP